MAADEKYTEKVMDHFMNPRNVGEIPDADGVGHVGNPVCGDIMELYIKVENDVIADAKFKTFGCGAAIATSSMLTELVKGKTVDEALQVSNRAVAEALGGLPQRKLHCSVLAEEALRSAVEDYKEKTGTAVGPEEHEAGCCQTEHPEVEITFLPSGTKVTVPSGKTVLEAAAAAGVEVPSECGGKGVCGSCAVMVEDGAENLTEETDGEKDVLLSLGLDVPHRLACRAQLKGPVVVSIPDTQK
jgi:nitrogen fixation NifU-like protein